MPLHDLPALDAIRHELERKFPGWHVWPVPKSTGDVTWCAQPWPLINSQSPEHLAAEITQAHVEATGDWPALVGIEDYGRIAPGIVRPG
jgi:hypothetical protein